MKNLSTYACSAALCFAAGQTSADTYPIVIDDTLNIVIFGSLLSLPMTGLGSYDDVTGAGHWSLTLDVSALGQGQVSFDQDWTMDSVTGIGVASAGYNCTGTYYGCAVATTELQGSLSATPTPVGGGNYIFAMKTYNAGTVDFPLTMETDDPGVRVTIDIPASQYECVNEGALVNASANITLVNDAELESVVWSVDGQPIASTLTLSEYVPLGQHTLSVVATITTGDQASTQQQIEVIDTVAPLITAFFSDSRSGDVITHIESRNTSFVQANLSASDDCDNNPDIEGFGGFSITDGDAMKIQGNQGKVELTTSSLQMKVEASDSSGNASSAQTSLSLLP